MILHYLPEIPEEWWAMSWLRSAIHPLSDALMVGGILGATVDTFLKRALMRDVGAVFIGWALPQKLRDYIREVSQTSIVRQNYRVHYKLTVSGNEVTAEVSTTVDVFNFSTATRIHQPQLSLDLHDRPNETAVRAEVRRGGRVCPWSAAKLAKRAEKSEHVLTWRLPRMFLAPQDVDKAHLEPACTILWEYEMTMPVPYTDFLSFMWPTVGVELVSDCPSDIEFTCDPCEAMKHGEGSRQWRYDRLYMPGQSIRVRWKRRAAA
jgi:hypothetical protein